MGVEGDWCSEQIRAILFRTLLLTGGNRTSARSPETAELTVLFSVRRERDGGCTGWRNKGEAQVEGRIWDWRVNTCGGREARGVPESIRIHTRGENHTTWPLRSGRCTRVKGHARSSTNLDSLPTCAPRPGLPASPGLADWNLGSGLFRRVVSRALQPAAFSTLGVLAAPLLGLGLGSACPCLSSTQNAGSGKTLTGCNFVF